MKIVECKHCGRAKRTWANRVQYQRGYCTKRCMVASLSGEEYFYTSRKWVALRSSVIKYYGRECMACGRTQGKICVDHIKPRSLYPEFQWDFNNLQVLCDDCNQAKSNTCTHDFRHNSKVYKRAISIT